MTRLTHSALGRGHPQAASAGLSRFQGIAVLAAVLLPIAAASLVYYTGLGIPKDTINQGDLLQPPVNVFALPFEESGPKRMALGAEKAKWRYLVIPAGNCGGECEKLLYTSRQVHIRLGDKADRVERLLVTASPLDDARRQQLQREHPRLRFAVLQADALQKLERDSGYPEWSEARALLVDQEGFAMMAYDNHHSGNQLLKDIKRLLKYSYEK